MIKTTPFHERLEQLNTTGLWGHWSGYLSALKYGMSPKHEYFAVRNSAGFFDTSPLYKYRITGTRRRAVARRRDDPRHPAVPARPGAVHASGATTAASSSRTAWSSGTPTTSSCSPRPSRTSATSATWSGGST